jgi:DNA-binding NarL/FixJ family response regulator
MPIRVFIVDKQEVFRTGLTLTCSATPGMEVIGHAESLETAEAIIRASEVDVLILDLDPFNFSQIELLSRIRAHFPCMRTLAFCLIGTADIAKIVLDFGVRGYLTKQASLDEVMVAIRTVYADRIFVIHSAEGARGPTSRTEINRHRIPAAGDQSLSGREREVVQMLGEGLTNKQVAERLYLSTKTVETYRARIMKKYQLRGRNELYQFAKTITSGELSGV